MANELPIFNVSDLLASLNQTLEYAYPAVDVEGEVASFKVNQGKFVFFDLKDASGSVGCFMTAWQLRMPIEDGMKVVVRATPKLTAWGKFSLTIQSIRPSGEGSIKKSYELLKAKLDSEGLFSPDRKRTLPPLPAHIAVISSTQAAGYADFITIINERWGGLTIEVAHTQVQGDGAADQMIRALEYFNSQQSLPEVIVLIRGGGSADDLAAFNDETLVRAIAASRVPTVVGVGHEIDETLADFVADVRAATPSNAAQIIVPDKRELVQQARHAVRLVAIKAEQAVDESTLLARQHMERAFRRMSERHLLHEQQLETSRGKLLAYDPTAVLRRGYAIVRGSAEIGGLLTIDRAKDILTAEVTHVETK